LISDWWEGVDAGHSWRRHDLHLRRLRPTPCLFVARQVLALPDEEYLAVQRAGEFVEAGDSGRDVDAGHSCPVRCWGRQEDTATAPRMEGR
jgi:hypothetical protein